MACEVSAATTSGVNSPSARAVPAPSSAAVDMKAQNGAGLKDAKDVVERSLDRGRASPPSAAPSQHLGRPGSRLSPGEVPRSAGLGRWLLVAAIVAAVVYFVLLRSPAAS